MADTATKSKLGGRVAERIGEKTHGGLVVDGLCRYGTGALSFTAEPGTFTAITGRSGAGKSTIVGCIAGFDKPDEGRVLLDGVNVHEMSRARLERSVGWVGAVIPDPRRARRSIPRLVVGDDPEAPFVVEHEAAVNVLTFLRQTPLDERCAPLLAAIRILCDQRAVVVVATGHRTLLAASDRVVTLP